jgi:hypothetical protein
MMMMLINEFIEIRIGLFNLKKSKIFLRFF